MTEFLSFLQPAPKLPEATTPVREYRHPERLGRVMLVATYHYGDRAYYDEIQRTIDEREAAGAKVHYEGVRRATAEQLAAATKDERIVLGMRQRSAGPDPNMLKIGLLFQKEALVSGPGWENHDIDELTAVRSFGADIIISNLLETDHVVRQSKESTMSVGELRSRIFSELASYRALSKLPEEEEIARRTTDLGGATRYHTMVTMREEIALQAADEHFVRQPDTDLVMLWGAGHAPTLQRSLRARGFALAEERQIPIVSSAAFMPAEDPYAQFIVPIEDESI